MAGNPGCRRALPAAEFIIPSAILPTLSRPAQAFVHPSRGILVGVSMWSRRLQWFEPFP